MAVGDTAEVAVRLTLIDQLSGGLTAAEDKLKSFSAAGTETAGVTTKLSAGFASGLGIGASLIAFNLAATAASDLTNFLEGSVAAAAALQAANVSLTQTLQVTGTGLDAQSASVQNAIGSVENLGFTSLDATQSFQDLLSATHNVADAASAESLAANLARQQNEDLATATSTLVNVEAGRYRGLIPLGIATTGITTTTQALGAVYDKVAGQADAFASTEEGASQRAGTAIDNLQVKIGQDLLPEVTKTENAFASFLNIVDGTTPATNQSMDDIAAFTLQFIPFGDALGKSTGLTNEAKTAIGSFGDALTAANGIMQGTHATQFALQSDLGATNALFEDNARSSKALAAAAVGTTGAMTGLHSILPAVNSDLGAVDNAAQIATGHFKDLGLAAILAGGQVAGAFQAAPGISGDRFDMPGGAGALGVGGVVGNTGGDDAAQAYLKQLQLDAQNAADAQNGLNAASKAYASTLKNDVTSAFQTAKQAGDDFLNSQHQKALAAIQDTLTLAQTQHTAALQQIADTLGVAATAAQNAVTAAQGALTARENQEQLAQLGQSVTSAQAALQAPGGNTTANQQAFQNALNALQNFKDQLNIAALQQQATNAQAAVTKATQAADATLTAAQAKAKADTTAEDTKYAAALKAFNADIAKQLADVVKHGAGLSAAIADIEKDFKAFHIALTPGGKPLAPVSVTVNLPPITLNGRAISAALSATSSPTQAVTVRTGQNRPVIIK